VNESIDLLLLTETSLSPDDLGFEYLGTRSLPLSDWDASMKRYLNYNLEERSQKF
jgi:hypothetical protein